MEVICYVAFHARIGLVSCAKHKEYPMHISSEYRRVLAGTFIILLASVLCPLAVGQATDSNLSQEQIKHFLQTAKVINSKEAKKGVTDTSRLTLSDGNITHDASFQSIDEHKTMMQFANGRMEMNFVDSYKYNIAGYELADMLGLDDLVPVYVERKWQGKTGSLSWWLPVKMDEEERLKHKIEVPDKDAWNKQMYRIRVFDQLIYDADPNLTNVLIGEDWKIWRIDFTRAFRRMKKVESLSDLERCDRQLLEKMKALDRAQLLARTKGFLDKGEVDAVMARRDKIVDHFQKLIAEKGENEVLY
jgi:hypothetical protein